MHAAVPLLTRSLSLGARLQFYEFGAFRSVSATIEVWGTNATLAARAVRLELSFVDLYSDWKESTTLDATLLPNQTTELLSMRVPGPVASGATSVDPSHSVVVGTRIVEAASGAVLARYADWPQPFRLVDFPDPELDVRFEGTEVRVAVGKPIKGLFFTVDGEGEGALGRQETVRWSDNAIDVFPGDPQVVQVRGLVGKRARVRVAYMGCERGRTVYEQ